MRFTLPVALLGLILLAPVALAQDEKPEPACADGTEPGPDGCPAWVEDCPPDMMCAYSHANATDGEEPTYGDCGGEVCAYDRPGNASNPDEPVQYGPDDCIDCMGPVDGGDGSCMDGEDGTEVCPDGVQYLDGSGGSGGSGGEADPIRGPVDGSCEHCRGDDADTAGDDAKEASGIGLAAALSVAAVAVAFLRRR